MQRWGWRVAFGVGALLALVVFFIRAPARRNAQLRTCRGKAGPARVRRSSPVPRPSARGLLVMAITAGGSAAFYAYTTYMQKFLVNTSGFSRATASQIMTIALVILLLIQPLAGRLSDRIGRKPVHDVLRDLAGRSSPIRSSPRLSVPAMPSPLSRLVMASLVILHGLYVDQRDCEGRAVPRRTSGRLGSRCLTPSAIRFSAGRPNIRAVAQGCRATSAGSTSISRRPDRT